MKALLRLRGKIRPEKQRSAVSYEQSVLPYQLPAKYPALNKAYYLRPFLLLILVFVSCGAALAQEPVGHTAPAAKAEAINGIVVSAESGEPLEGATVRIKNTNATTITNLKGEFTLIPDNREGEIEVSFIGYLVKDVPFSLTTNSIIIALEEDFDTLDEAIAIGYGETSKRFNTGSVSTITSKDIEKQPVTNVLSALSGRMPGVFVQTANGLPGGNINIQIRGKGSIAAGTDPLYIIDGVPFDGSPIDGRTGLASASIIGAVSPFNSINPSDIESITVLKDADATAIYGSRGANGVVLVNTKKGKSGKTVTSITMQQGVNRIANTPKMLNLQQYLEIRREAFVNDGAVPSADPSSKDYARDLMVWDTTQTTDWSDYLFGTTGYVSNIQAAISGGDEQTTFHTSGNFRRETTVLPGDNRYFRGGLLVGLNHSSTDKRFQINVSTSLTKDNNHSTNPSSALSQMITLPPHYSLLDDEGNYNWQAGANPLAALQATSKIQTNNVISNLTLKYNPLKSLDIKIATGYNKFDIDQTQLFPTRSLHPTVINYSQFGKNKNQSFIIEPQLDYIAKFQNATLSLMLGATYQNSQTESQFMKVSDFNNEGLMENLSSGGSIDGRYGTYTNYKYASLFGRASYNLFDKYIINATVRRDGSSRFGDGKRYGNFGSLGAAWLFGDEDWLKESQSFISFGKVRGSYGIVGNDQISDYQYLSAYSSSIVYMDIAGLVPSRIANANFHWEGTQKLELGLELGLFRNRAFLNVNRYINQSKNQLVQYGIPLMTGFSSYQANMPAVIENTGWEIELHTENVKNNNFSWSSSFNITVPKNRLKSYQNFESSSYHQTLEIGYDITRIYGYRFVEIDSQTGLAVYAGQDGNSSTSPYYYHTIGKQTPDFYGGFGNGLTYRKWTLDVLFQFAKQISQGGIPYTPGQALNNYVTVWSRWQKAGDISSIPKSSRKRDSYYKNSSANYFDASYIRLKNLALSYSISQDWANKKISGLTVFAEGQNLLTFWDENSAIMDPESGMIATGSINIPPMKSFILGIRLTI